MKIKISDAAARELHRALGDALGIARTSAGTVDTRAEVSPLAREIQAVLTAKGPQTTTQLRYLVASLPEDDKAAYKALTQVRADAALDGWWKRADKPGTFGRYPILWAAPGTQAAVAAPVQAAQPMVTHEQIGDALRDSYQWGREFAKTPDEVAALMGVPVAALPKGKTCEHYSFEKGKFWRRVHGEEQGNN